MSSKYVAYNPFRGYRPHAKQRELHSFENKIVCLLAARRSGKTYGVAREVVRRVLNDYVHKLNGTGRWESLGPQSWRRRGKQTAPFLLYWIVAPTYELTEELRHEIQAVLGFVDDGGLIAKQVRNQYWLKGGVRIDFKSADKPHLLVSKGVDGIVLEEVCRMSQDVWTEHLLPTTLDSDAWLIAISSPRGRDWVWRELYCKGSEEEAVFLAEEEGLKLEDIMSPMFKSVSWKTTDNERIPNIRAKVEALKKVMPLALWKRSFESTFDAFVGQCFDTITEDIWLKGKAYTPNSFSRIYYGVDWGYRHNAAIVVWGKEHNTGRFIQVDMMSKPGMLVDSDDSWRSKNPDCLSVLLHNMQQKWGIAEVYCGHENVSGRKSFERRGFDVRIGYLGRLAGLQWFQSQIHMDKVRVCSGAMYRELAGLHFPTGSIHTTHSTIKDELWVEVKDDAFAASRYALSYPIQSFGTSLTHNPYGLQR